MPKKKVDHVTVIRHVAKFPEQKKFYLKLMLCWVIKVKRNCHGQNKVNKHLKAPQFFS